MRVPPSHTRGAHVGMVCLHKQIFITMCIHCCINLINALNTCSITYSSNSGVSSRTSCISNLILTEYFLEKIKIRPDYNPVSYFTNLNTVLKLRFLFCRTSVYHISAVAVCFCLLNSVCISKMSLLEKILLFEENEEIVIFCNS